MFEHFTFGAQAQFRYHEQNEVAASPRDTSCTAPAVQLPESVPTSMDESPMHDILCRLSYQSLEAEDSEMPVRWTEDLTCSAAEKTYYEDQELSYYSSRRGPTILRTSLPISRSTHLRSKTGVCKRQARQLNTQLQSCTNHVKDISTMVKDMITTNTQCSISSVSKNSNKATLPHDLPSPPISPTWEVSPPFEVDHDGSSTTQIPTEDTTIEDEGFSELDDHDALELLIRSRQASLSNPSHRTHQEQQPQTASGVRKFSVMRYGAYRSYSYSASESDAVAVDDVNCYMPRESGRGMVLCKPRMRLRRGDEERRARKREKRRMEAEGGKAVV